MPRRAPRSRRSKVADRVLEPPQETLLDLLDHLLDKGVMATGDVTGPGTTRVVVGSAKEVGDMVRDWVEEIASLASTERADGDDAETRG